MELAVIGLVTGEGLVRAWTRSGAVDLLVNEHDRLRNALGIGALDREPMVPGAKTEVLLLAEDLTQVYAVAPFEAGERPQLVTRAFDVVPVAAVHGEVWSDAVIEPIDRWMASRAVVAAARGEDIVLFERDAQEEGWRVASLACCRGDDGDWSWRVATNAAPDGYALWDAAADGRGGAVLETPYNEAAPASLAALLLSVVTAWPGGPRNVVVGWDPNQDGPNLHAAALVSGATTLIS